MELILKATVILLIAFAIAAALRRASAAMRHLVWVAAFACLLALPLISTLAPKWAPARPRLIPSHTTVLTVSGSAVSPVQTRGVDWLLILWAAGAALICSRTMVGLLRVRRIAKQSAAFPDALVRRSPEVTVPVTCGLLKPVILVPEDAVSWPADKLRNVIAHEMAHVERGDWLVHIGVQFVCALYWFHPLVWLAAAHMAREREHACDDLVLDTGVQPSVYAAHLLEFAGAAALPASVAMAGRPAFFEHRVRAILDPHLNRRPPLRRHIVVSCAVAMALLAPLAAFRAMAQTVSAALSGAVYDASGAAVPGAVVTVSDPQSTEATTTADDGTFSLTTVPAGDYTVEVQKPGFQTARLNSNGARPQQTNIVLEIGPVNQALDVVGDVPAPAAPPTHGPQRIRVGGNVQPARLLEHVKPVYPEDLQKQGIEGTVLIHAVISIDGRVLSATVMNSAISKELADAALDAVRQWRYAPVLLNGVPVEVVTTVAVNFTLPR
jgi:TonB family protein